MTTRKDIALRLSQAERSLAALSERIGRDSRSYLAAVLAKGPRAAVEALLDGKLILAPADRAVLRDAMGASLDVKRTPRRWWRWLSLRHVSWRRVRYLALATVVIVLKVAIVTAPVSAWLYVAHTNAASRHPTPSFSDY